jgi:cytochrome c-type biogenesis protein CcmH
MPSASKSHSPSDCHPARGHHTQSGCHPERSRFSGAERHLPLRNPVEKPTPLKKSAQLAALLIAIIALLGAGDRDPASRFNYMGHQLMCICSCNQILLECNHVGCPNSDEMRNELMAGVQRGDSDSLVEQSFIQKYGPTVLAAPPTTGFVNRAVWVVPFIALFLGLLAVVSVVRIWKKRPAPAIAGGAPPLHAAELERFRDQARRETEI